MARAACHGFGFERPRLARAATSTQQLRRRPCLPRSFLFEVVQQGLQLLSLRRFLRTLRRPERKTWRANPKKPPKALLSGKVPLPTPWSPDGFYEVEEEPGQWMEQYTGEVYVQELASMLPVEVLKAFMPLESVRVLDLCSAPGSKASQIALELKGESMLMCNEVKPSRARILSCNLLKSGVADRCLILQEDGRRLGAFAKEAFDAILLDAPCSGEGNLRRIPEVLERIQSPKYGEIKAENTKLQRELLQSAWQLLRPGGFLIYSTCTLNSQENEEVLQNLPATARIMDVSSRLGLPECGCSSGLRLWPHQWDSEGFFVACIKKQGQHALTTSSVPFVPLSWKLVEPDEWRGLKAENPDEWPDLTSSELLRVARHGGDFYLLPPLKTLTGLEKLLPLTTPGLRLASPELQLHGAKGHGADWVALAAQLGGGLGAYTAQMDRLILRGRWKTAVQVFANLAEERLQADLIACNTLMKAYALGNATASTRKLLAQMRSSRIAPDIATYAAAMKAQADDAAQLFEELRQDHLQPDVVTYTVLIGAYANRSCRAEAETTLQEMLDSSLQPDVITHTALLDLYARVGDINSLRSVLETMDAPNVVSYTVLMKALVKLQSLQEAQDTLTEMRQKHVQPNLITYTSLLSAFAKRGEVARAEELVRSMQTELLEMDVVSYGALISTYARAGNGQGALKVLRNCEKERIVPNMVCYATALRALRREGEDVTAESLLLEMSACRLHMTGISEPGRPQQAWEKG